jgi:hypothetical protein
MMRISSLSEKPVRHHARRLADWINPTGAEKVHSLVDKAYRAECVNENETQAKRI